MKKTIAEILEFAVILEVAGGFMFFGTSRYPRFNNNKQKLKAVAVKSWVCTVNPHIKLWLKENGTVIWTSDIPLDEFQQLEAHKWEEHKQQKPPPKLPPRLPPPNVPLAGGVQ